MTHDNYCLHCGLERGRPGGCATCGDNAPGRNVENHPLCLPAGTLLNDQYRIGRVLGAGGFGITYLAIDVRLGLRVAIKEYMPRSDATRGTDRCTVQPATHVDEEPYRFGLGKFLEEARVLARISEKDNPRIVTVYNFFEANGTAYLVMRYLEGQSLAQYLSEKGGRLPEKEAIYIATAMLDGLREVHAAGLIHRDIKPHNVFVTTDGGIKLIDFGAARYAQGVKSKALTQVLTPPYAPFEQYFEKGKQGPWTDIYAVGATLYQMLTGKLPPEAPARVDEDTLEPPSVASGGKTSAYLDAVLAKALSPQAKDRFRTVSEFQVALKTPETECNDGRHTSISHLDTRINKRRWKTFLRWTAVVAVLALVGVGIVEIINTKEQLSNKSQTRSEIPVISSSNAFKCEEGGITEIPTEHRWMPSRDQILLSWSNIVDERSDKFKNLVVDEMLACASRTGEFNFKLEAHDGAPDDEDYLFYFVALTAAKLGSQKLISIRYGPGDYAVQVTQFGPEGSRVLMNSWMTFLDPLCGFEPPGEEAIPIEIRRKWKELPQWAHKLYCGY